MYGTRAMDPAHTVRKVIRYASMTMLNSRYIPYVAGGAAVLALGLSWYVVTTARPAPSPVPQASAPVDLAALAAGYRTVLGEVERDLTSFLDRALTADDLPKLTGLRDRLVGLSVPRELQQRHLTLVLGLTRLVELLSPGRVVVASRSVPTVSSIQAELKRLLAS